jgi:hypothetical protein
VTQVEHERVGTGEWFDRRVELMNPEIGQPLAEVGELDGASPSRENKKENEERERFHEWLS